MQFSFCKWNLLENPIDLVPNFWLISSSNELMQLWIVCCRCHCRRVQTAFLATVSKTKTSNFIHRLIMVLSRCRLKGNQMSINSILVRSTGRFLNMFKPIKTFYCQTRGHSDEQILIFQKLEYIEMPYLKNQFPFSSSFYEIILSRIYEGIFWISAGRIYLTRTTFCSCF